MEAEGRAGQPSVIMAEESLLGAMLTGTEASARAAIIVAPHHFYYNRHRHLFTALVALQARQCAPDIASVVAELEREGNLAVCGGPAGVAHFYQYATTGANLEAHVAVVREYAGRRAARKVLAHAAGALDDPTTALDATVTVALEQLQRAMAGANPDAEAERLLSQVMSDEDLWNADLAPMESLVGDGYLPRGGLAIMVGHSGMGKSFLAMQLMRCMATGDLWLGYQVRPGRAGMLQLEMPAVGVRDRLFAGLDHERLGGRTDWLVMPEGLGYITDPAVADRLALWVERRSLSLLVMDPMHALHAGDENVQADVGRIMGPLATIRRRTGVSIILLHHVNKLQVDKDLGLRTSVLLAVRGSGRLTNDPDTIVGVLERHGQRLLVNAKTRWCRSEECVGLQQDEHGYFIATATPAQAARAAAAKVVAALEWAGPGGMTMEELEKRSDLHRNTVKKHLESIDAVSIRTGRTLRWFLRGHLTETQELALESGNGHDAATQSDPFQ